MNLNLVKLSHYNIPHLVENANQDWISFGEDNLYPNYLLDLFLGSAINGALVKSIGAMIYGEGIAATNVDESTDTKESYLRLTELLHNSDDDVLKDLALDLKLFGGCYVNVIWSRDRSKIAKMKHIPAQYIRSGKMIDGEIQHYYYSADWANCKKAEYKPRAYKAFDTEDRSQASQILMIRDKNPALFYGFAPDYVAATDWIQMELEIAQFHLSNITSGMTPSMHVGFSNGVPTDEERRTIERQLNQKFAGTGNAGKILITFNDGKETAPIIEPIQMNDAQSAWVEMSKQSVSQILAGHRVTSPILFGIRAEGGGLGNNADELRDAYSLFNNTVIIPFQTTLLKGLDKIFRVNDINLDLYFKTLKPADFIDLEVTKTQSEEDQEKEGVTKEDIDTEELVEMSIDVEDDDVCLDYFDDIGITLDDDEWFEAYSEEIDEHSIDSRYHEFAYAPAGTPNVADSSSDEGMFRILYRYSQTLSISKKTGKVTSRKFCEKMVAKSKQGTLYRMEDLEKASKKAVNKGFGPNGTNTYNIALYKGGANCKHKWIRVFYFRRQVPKGRVFVDVDGKEYKGGEFLPNGTLNNFREVSQQFANNKIKMPDDSEMRKTTWKMKNHGFLRPRRETERSRSTPV
tara:strand:- start:3476 stop:5365 length:1890 start_codon:yes stop_codon:yes gene_type:complete